MVFLKKALIKFEVLDLCNDKFDVVMVFFKRIKKKKTDLLVFSSLLDYWFHYLIYTSQAPSMFFAPNFKKYFIIRLNSIGMKNVSMHNCDQVVTAAPENRENFLKKVFEWVK